MIHTTTDKATVKALAAWLDSQIELQQVKTQQLHEQLSWAGQSLRDEFHQSQGVLLGLLECRKKVASAEMMRGKVARSAGKKHRVFDWDKAAKLIREYQPQTAEAGLKLAWEYTGGCIYRDGKADMESYCYLSSDWATPQLVMDGGTPIDCWVWGHETEWRADTRWPESAMAILEAPTPTP